MQDGPSFGIVELEETLESNGGKAEEKGASKLAKIRPATLTDFDGDCRKGHVFFNMCCLYFVIIGDLFPNDQACIHWVLSFFKLDCVACFANKVSNMRQRARGTTSKTGMHLRRCFLTSSVQRMSSSWLSQG